MKSINLIGISLLLGCALSDSSHGENVVGAGAAFPAIVYNSWASTYTKETGHSVSYKATNAADGAKRMVAREIDFGAVHPALSPADLQKSKLVQIPTLVGAVIPVINLNGVQPGALRLTGAVLAEIFAGNIRSWDDPQIAALNPNLKLPTLPITRVVRENGAGFTDAWTRYLAISSPMWAKAFGSGDSIVWRGSVTTSKGNDGMAQTLKATPGSIGYTSYDRVMKEQLTFTLLKNRSGKYVAPSDSSLKAGLALSQMFRNGDETVSLIDLAGDDVWPILDVTYVLIDGQPKTAAKISPTLRYLYWVFSKGDSLVKGTGFAPLPAIIQTRVVRRLGQIRPIDGEPLQLYK